MPDLPRIVAKTACSMTRGAIRETHSDPATLLSRRDDLLSRYGYSARVRDDEGGPVLVCYPDAWVEDGRFQPDELESTDNAVELSLQSRSDADGWDAVAAHNRAVAETVRSRHGEIHGTNAERFAIYMANHHARRVETADEIDVEQFLTEYFPRNTWPTPAEAEAVESSLVRLFEAANVRYPLESRGANSTPEDGR